MSDDIEKFVIEEIKVVISVGGYKWKYQSKFAPTKASPNAARFTVGLDERGAGPGSDSVAGKLGPAFLTVFIEEILKALRESARRVVEGDRVPSNPHAMFDAAGVRL